MFEGIQNTQSDSVAEINGNDFFSQKTTEKSNTNPFKTPENAYELSLSEDGWKVLGNGNEEDKGGPENGEELTEEEQRKIEELKKIDQKVRIHEQAHVSAAGGYARGGANYSYVTGPDSKKYANAGYVNLDTSPESTPEATIRKAAIIRKAALAPADPSPSDRQIATEATRMQQEAQKELVENKNSEQTTSTASPLFEQTLS